MFQTNPFYRGLSNLSIVRKAIVDYGIEFPFAYRIVHSHHADVPDHSLIGEVCVFNEEVAFVFRGDPAPVAPEDLVNTDHGTVRSIIYEITGKCGDAPVHVGDYETREQAQAIVDAVQFHTGTFSRCWEISTAHVSPSDITYLENLSATGQPNGLYFEVFEIPASHATGIKLIATPWANEIGNVDKQKALLEQGRVPEPIAHLLIKASEADVRILILDPDAEILDGLPVFDW
nr:ABC transporter substrate-binding protein [Alcaligenes faecalis]